MRGTFLVVSDEGIRRVDSIDVEIRQTDKLVIRVSPGRPCQGGEPGAVVVQVVKDLLTERGRRGVVPYGLRRARD